MKSTVGYLRISKDPEGRQVGIDRQQEDLHSLAARLGLKISETFADNDISASTLSKKKRPAYEEMMALVEGGRIGTILAYSNSRLTRRPLELERLIAAHDRTGVQFHTVVSGQDDLSTADGRMVARIKASVDAAESERMGERIRRAQQQMREQGRWHGGWRPFGFAEDGLTPRDDEGAVIAAMCRDLLAGRSVISLVRQLNGQGVCTSTGKKWSTRTLIRVLRRPHPAVEDGIHEAVAALLDDPSRRTTPGPERRWLLSGLARCGVCDGPLRGSASSMGPGRGTYPAYRCLGPGKHIVISAITLDEYVSAIVVARLRKPDAADLFQPTTTMVDLAALAAEEKGLRKRLDGLADDLDLDERTLSRRAAKLNARIDEIGELRTAATRSTPLEPFRGRDPQEVWATRDLEQRRAIVDVLMTVYVDRGARGVVPREHRWRLDLPAFDPQRVQIKWRMS
jgi:site-specific DNA recombinase